jgi:PAS domain S-box-containing protein
MSATNDGAPPGPLRGEELFARIIDLVAHPVFVKDREFRFALVNRALCDLVGRPREALLGKTDYDFFPVEQADFFRQKDAEMFASGAEVVIEEEPITDASGKVHILATTKAPLKDASGAVSHLVGIIHDITRLKAAEEELRRRNAELAEQVRDHAAALIRLDVANRELEAFSYSVSHDLRAPLRTLDGFSQALLEDQGDRLDAQGKDYLRRVRENAQKMGRLIDDLLGLARVTRTELHREAIDLADVAREVAAELGEASPPRAIDLVIPASLPAIGDRRLVRALLGNVLGNAWKFTGKTAHARVELGIVKAGWGEPAFFVRDNGAGFDEEYAGKLFRPFARLHSAEEFPGTGIGLATAQRIVHRHGGRVWAEGTVGGGATFYFTLPG